MPDTPPDALCPGCFADKGAAHPCPHCGYDERAARGPLLLPHRAVLNGQFIVGRVLGKPGGFGITYLGWDFSLHTRVAIKEYLPRDLVGRGPDRYTLAAHSGDEREQFRDGLEQFLREARTLAQIDHPNIVRVRQFFEANGTAYLVMDYYRGLTLTAYLDRQGGRLPEGSAVELLLPILDGLRTVHAKGYLHRDIKPQNIYLVQLESGGTRPLLLDFGAARQAIGEHSRSLSVVVSAGYAPFEQYHRKGHQGTWSDVYSAAATLYRMVTGQRPPDANERMAGDELRPAAAFGVSRRLSDALAAGLAMAPEARPPTIQAFQSRLMPHPPPDPDEQSERLVRDDRTHPRRWWPAAVLAILVLALTLVGLGIWSRARPNPITAPAPPAAARPEPTPESTPEPTADDLAARLEAADRRAFASAVQTDTEAAYRDYFARCAVTGCANAAEARTRLRALQAAAERQAQARAEAERQARAREEAERQARAQEEAERQARAREEAERQARAREEAERQARAREETERQARAQEEAERQARAREEAERQARAREEAERQARAQEETERQAREKRLGDQMQAVEGLLEQRQIVAARLALDAARAWDRQGTVEAFRRNHSAKLRMAAEAFLEQGKKALARAVLKDLEQWDPQGTDYRDLRERMARGR